MEASDADKRAVFDSAQRGDLASLEAALDAAVLYATSARGELDALIALLADRHPFYEAAYVALWNNHLCCFHALAAAMGTKHANRAADKCYCNRGGALEPEALNAILARYPSRESWEMLSVALSFRSVRMVEAVLAVPQFDFRDTGDMCDMWMFSLAYHVLGGSCDAYLAHLREVAPEVAARLEARGVWLGPCAAREAALRC